MVLFARNHDLVSDVLKVLIKSNPFLVRGALKMLSSNDKYDFVIQLIGLAELEHFLVDLRLVEFSGNQLEVDFFDEVNHLRPEVEKHIA